jgi:putative membrane protein
MGFSMLLGTLLVLGALIAGVVVLVRRLNRPAAAPPEPSTTVRTSAESTLADRFARGEIDEEEYRARLAALRDAHQTQ